MAMMKTTPKALLALLVLLGAANLSAQTPADDQAGEHFQAAKEAEKAKDLQLAVSEYREALKLKPEIAEAWVNLGLDLYIMQRDDEAIAAFQQALERKPDLLPANLFLGMSYLRTNQYQKAVAPLKKVVSLYPKELKAHINLSYAYQEMGRDEEAAKVLQKANEIFPNNTEVLYNLGKTYTKLMEKAYKQMAQVDEDSYRYHQVMGDSYELRKDYPNAQAEYLKAIEKSPDPYLPGLHYSLGSSYWMEGMWEPAIEQFKQELAISPDDYLTIWKLGDTYLFQRKYDEARPYLERAIKEKPDLGQAYRDMGKLCIQTGQPEQALVYLKKVVALDPEEPSVHYLLAQVYRKMGKEPELKAELELFQKLKKQETDRAVKHPDTSALIGTESTNERPQEEETVDDLK
jgi:tetratricopeptide (TPR) repeat protein